MKRQIDIIVLLCFLLASCINQNTASTPNKVASQPPVQPDSSTPTSAVIGASTNASPVPTSIATANTNCADADVNKLGNTIASSYSFTNSQEVITWFCNGAEFEDIIVALETEDVTGAAAEDLLQMRADGLSWDEIWLDIGLYNK